MAIPHSKLLVTRLGHFCVISGASRLKFRPIETPGTSPKAEKKSDDLPERSDGWRKSQWGESRFGEKISQRFGEGSSYNASFLWKSKFNRN